MSHVNVIFALRDTHFQLVLDNFRVDENGDRIRTDLTRAQARKLKDNFTGMWPVATVGANNYRVLSFTLPEVYENANDPSQGHKWINFLEAKWPGVWIVVGVWQRNGAPWGCRTLPMLRDENGDPILTPPEVDFVLATDPWNYWYNINDAIYPIHPQHMRIMPEDSPGVPASAPKDVNLMMGWMPRRWS